jgi:hypothetical protein
MKVFPERSSKRAASGVILTGPGAVRLVIVLDGLRAEARRLRARACDSHRKDAAMGLDSAHEELLAKQQIRDALSRYCRGLDRMDKQMAYAVWHADGTAHYEGIFEGTGHGFVDWVWQAHARMSCHSHQITNVLVEVEGERAASEAYVTVMLWSDGDPPERQTEIVARGRYLDRWSQRGGRWAIDHRLHLVDAQSIQQVTRGDTAASSARDESDPSFQFIPKA